MRGGRHRAARARARRARRWEVVVRAYDDGAAFRYRFPAQEGWTRLVIAGERTGFRLPDDALAYALPLKGFTSSHEARYRKGPIAEIPGDWLLGLPLLVELPGTGWAAIAEAELTDYAGLYLARDGTRGATLAARLSPLPGEPNVAVRADLPHDSPWRVLMIADRVERLVESDLVLNLNAPCAIGDTSWIKPGKTTFPWWNGFHEEGVPFEMGLNTATAKYYIDFCAEAGLPYHSLDGLDNIAWYGGPIVPYGGADITKGIAGLDLREVLRHAESKGVKIRLWMHWQAAEAHMDRAFPLYREWGVEGVMLDFMDRDDQEMVRFLRRALELAAENQLTVTLHGVGAPTGLERTYPNLLTQRGGAEPGVRQVGQARRAPGARADCPVHADARRAARLPPGLVAGRARRRVPAAQRGPAGHGHALPDARLLRRLPEPPADGGRLSLRLSRPPGPAGARGDPGHLGRHPLPGRRGRRVRRRRPSSRGRVVGRGDDRPEGPRAGGPAGLPGGRAVRRDGVSR